MVCGDYIVRLLFVFGRPFVKPFALCYRSVVCLSCLSVTLVYCCQMARWMKMKLGMEVGLGPDIVLDGDPCSCPLKGAQPSLFGPCLLCPNSWMDQNATWYEGRPRPRTHCVRWGPYGDPGPIPQRGTAPSFRPISVVAKWLGCHLVGR